MTAPARFDTHGGSRRSLTIMKRADAPTTIRIRGGEPAARAALERTFPDRDWSSGKQFSLKAKAAACQVIAALIGGGFTNIELSLPNGDHDDE